MPQVDVKAHLIGRRYNCDECGLEMSRKSDRADLQNYLADPIRYLHVCEQGHELPLPRTYPGWDVLITTEPLLD